MPLSEVIRVAGEVDTCSFSYKWVIDYRATGCEKLGEAIISPVFSALYDGSQYEWQLKIHPNEEGPAGSNKGSVAIFLENMSKMDFTGIANFSIVTDQNNMVRRCSTDVQVFRKNGGSYGILEFVKRNFISKRANTLLENGKLTILCQINANIKQNKTKEEKAKENPLQELSSDLEKLIDEKDFSDVSINVDGKTLRAHKSILGKRSRVFATMFQTEMKEKRENKVEITDIRHEVFLEMLRYMYSGKVNNIDAIAGELLVAADKYSLDGLKALCEKSMGDNLSVDGVFEIFKIAETYGIDDLRAKAIEFIVSRAADIVEKQEFKGLPNDIVCEVCQALAKNKK